MDPQPGRRAATASAAATSPCQLDADHRAEPRVVHPWRPPGAPPAGRPARPRWPGPAPPAGAASAGRAARATPRTRPGTAPCALRNSTRRSATSGVARDRHAEQQVGVPGQVLRRAVHDDVGARSPAVAAGSASRTCCRPPSSTPAARRARRRARRGRPACSIGFVGRLGPAQVGALQGVGRRGGVGEVDLPHRQPTPRLQASQQGERAVVGVRRRRPPCRRRGTRSTHRGDRRHPGGERRGHAALEARRPPSRTSPTSGCRSGRSRPRRPRGRSRPSRSAGSVGPSGCRGRATGGDGQVAGDRVAASEASGGPGSSCQKYPGRRARR